MKDEITPTPTVNDVPISTYQGQAIVDSEVNVPLMDGKSGIICFAKTTKLIATIPTAIPVIASRWFARRQSMPRKKPPSRAPYVKDAIDSAT
ncbi:MAG TPA: hypothetical protein VLJ83_00165, partial [Gemmatimonadaceae bacterium]|nr:hypothetical protein [Gemmatimonadaceae bacterium]